jgi:hypothetical protein
MDMQHNFSGPPSGDFIKATQRIWHTSENASLIELPVITGNEK